MLLYFCVYFIVASGAAGAPDRRDRPQRHTLSFILLKSYIRTLYFVALSSLISQAFRCRKRRGGALYLPGHLRRRFDLREGARCVQSHDEGPRFHQHDTSICKNHIYLSHSYRKSSLTAEGSSIDDAMTLNLLLRNTETQRKALLDFQTDFAISQTALICWQAKHGKQGQKVVMQ
jgi:hypothetical protein